MSPADAPREFRARVSLNGQPGPGSGPIRVDAAGIDCEAGQAGPLRIDFGDVASLAREDLAVELSLFEGTCIRFDKGGALDDLWDLARARFLARVSDSLRFAPTDSRHTFDGRIELEGSDGFASLSARVSITRLGLNYLSDSGPCAQIPFGALGDATFDTAGYDVTIPVEPGPAARRGACLRLSKLARRTEEFLEFYRQARNRSRADTARCLDALAPNLGAGARMALAGDLMVGRMVSRDRCEALAPGGWQTIWDSAAGMARVPYREALQDLAGSAERLWLGLRPYGGVPRDPTSGADPGAGCRPPKGSAAGLSATHHSVAEAPAVGDSVGADEGTDTFLHANAENMDAVADSSDFPVVYAAAILPGTSSADDRLALDVLSETDHATYIYRVAPVPAGLGRDEAGAWLAATASYTLLALDFKKEPLYLPEPEILGAREGLYRAAFRRLPGLRDMRLRLVGRAVHVSPAAWLARIETLK